MKGHRKWVSGGFPMDSFTDMLIGAVFFLLFCFPFSNVNFSAQNLFLTQDYFHLYI